MEATRPPSSAPLATPHPAAHQERAYLWHVTGMSVALGLLFALAVRTTDRIRNSGLPNARLGVSAAMLSKLREQNNKVTRENEALREQIGSLHDAARTGETSARLLRQQLTNYKALTGYAAVRGPGLQIVLHNSATQPRPGTESQASGYLIDVRGDVNGVIQELWAAGAEAIALASGNETSYRRFVLTSVLHGDGPGGTLEGRGTAPPYFIRAIGNPKELRAALNMPEGIIQIRGLDVLKMIVIREAKELILPAYDPPAAG